MVTNVCLQHFLCEPRIQLVDVCDQSYNKEIKKLVNLNLQVRSDWITIVKPLFGAN